MGFGKVQNFFVTVITLLSCGLFSLPANSKELGAMDSPSLPKKTTKSTEETSWIHISPSIRPAYVGIHGGTAPITLLKGEGGSVYAITGQTGSDFVQALRSANSSLQQKNDSDITSGAATSSLPRKKDFPEENYFTALTNSAIQDLSVYDHWADSPQWFAILQANSSHTKQKNNQAVEIIEPKPINYPDIEFKTGAEVQKLAKKTVDMQIFGFSDDDMPPASALNGTNVARYTPLKLNDYREIIGITVQ